MDAKRLILLAALFVGGLAGAQEPDDFQRRLARYKAMSAKRRAELRRRYKDFQGLSSAEQEKVRDRFQSFTRKGAKEQERIARNMARLKRMSPQKRAQLRRRQGKLAAAIERVRRSLTPEERARLDKLKPRERRAAMRRLIRERVIERSLTDLPAEERARIEKQLGKTRDPAKRLELARKTRRGYRAARQSVEEMLRVHRKRFAQALMLSRRAKEGPEKLLGRVEAVVRQLQPDWKPGQVRMAARMILKRIRNRLPGADRGGDRKRGSGDRKRGDGQGKQRGPGKGRRG